MLLMAVIVVVMVNMLVVKEWRLKIMVIVIMTTMELIS